MLFKMLSHLCVSKHILCCAEEHDNFKTNVRNILICHKHEPVNVKLHVLCKKQTQAQNQSKQTYHYEDEISIFRS